MAHGDHHTHGSTRRTGIALLVFLGIAAFFLLSEHRAHVLGFLPYLLVLACPLLHLFHHGGRGHHHGRQEHPRVPPGITKAGNE
jgi:hypothetical protein